MPRNPPVYQCDRGHMLCNECHGKLTNCPVCRLPLGKTRSLITEKVLIINQMHIYVTHSADNQPSNIYFPTMFFAYIYLLKTRRMALNLLYFILTSFHVGSSQTSRCLSICWPRMWCWANESPTWCSWTSLSIPISAMRRPCMSTEDFPNKGISTNASIKVS